MLFPFHSNCSMSQVSIYFKLWVIFTLYKVVFQDLLTKKMIDEGFYLHGLYYFSHDSQLSTGFKAAFYFSHKHLLWHHHLAYLSEYVLSKISLIQIKKPLIYKICCFSKSIRHPFNSSLSWTTHEFELVHSDV